MLHILFAMNTSLGDDRRNNLKPWFVRSAFSFLAGSCFLVAAPLASAQAVKVAMAAEHWQTDTGVFEKIQGMDALALHDGSLATAKDVTLRDGTIEFDVQPLVMGAGLAFRQRDKDTFESFYMRPMGKCSESPNCLQYAPQTHGVLLWDLYPQYQSAAPIRDGEWNHIKIVLSGKRMNVYVNGGPSPSLVVGHLEGDAAEGGLGVAGPGYFANFTVKPDVTEGLEPDPEPDPAGKDLHLVRNWQLAPASELAPDKNPAFDEMPPSSAAWRPITAERGGLINISRQYGLPLPYPRRNLTWIRTTINSDKAQTIRTAIGWVREIWVFVNGKLVYSDKNLFQPPSARKNPEGRCALTNGSFQLPLNAGSNEVAIAVASGFYGWAAIFRPDDITGLRLAEK
jgi:hypothetical protein